MKQLTDLVIQILDSVEDSVPDFIKAKVEQQYWPEKMF
jgi:hypothetical protein